MCVQYIHCVHNSPQPVYVACQLQFIEQQLLLFIAVINYSQNTKVNMFGCVCVCVCRTCRSRRQAKGTNSNRQSKSERGSRGGGRTSRICNPVPICPVDQSTWTYSSECAVSGCGDVRLEYMRVLRCKAPYSYSRAHQAQHPVAAIAVALGMRRVFQHLLC